MSNKPTEKQRKAFENIQKGMTKKDAMLAAGYDETSAINPGANLVETPGYKALIQEYKKHLMKAGVSLEVLAEIQAEGLFDQNAGVRLGYIKETKKDLGLEQKDQPTTAIQINFNEHAKKEQEVFEE